jgi:hypothetical protein
MLVVSSNTDWSLPGAPTDFQFTDVTINGATTLTVPSGTVIRCTGTFTNNGTVTVQAGAKGAIRRGVDSTTTEAFHATAHPGVSKRTATDGEAGDNSADRSGGIGGVGLSAFEARTLTRPGVNAGGGGGTGGVFATGDDPGSDGGGSLVVLCQGAITNAGTIDASGASDTASGGGGGAGGIVVLASRASVSNGGTINAKGGAGEGEDNDEAAAGGGGGGIVHLLAPSIGAGTIDVSGGAAGSFVGTVLGNPRSGGGGGGACGGSGGVGGDVLSTNLTSVGTAGSTGQSLQSLVDPTALF